MKEDLQYHEKMTSGRTIVLFVGLAFLFSVLFTWRVAATGLRGSAVVFLIFFVVFSFYIVNYRKLVIRITPEALKLTFGIFTWTVALDDIESCRIDNLTPLERYGGAGIHFMTVHGRYRANFNFLEYPRLVIALKRKSGLVKDISFSTRRPDEIQGIIFNANRGNQASQP
jgi:hypothetical protein